MIDVQTSIRRDKKKQQEEKSRVDKIVKLWILTPTLSQAILNSFEAKSNKDWTQGIYFLPPAFSTGIVVKHQTTTSTTNTLGDRDFAPRKSTRKGYI